MLYKPGKDTIQVGVSEHLGMIIRSRIEKIPEEYRESAMQAVVYAIKKEIDSILQLPEGPTRAKIIHSRMDRALLAWWKHNPETHAKVACFTCKEAGCCHTNVDITEDEAKLIVKSLAEPLSEEQLRRMELQAAVPPDSPDEFGKLSFGDRACIFLKDNRCSIYANRPFVCRKWFVCQPDTSECARYTGRPLVQLAENAEVLSSAIFSCLPSGRLANLIKEELERKK